MTDEDIRTTVQRETLAMALDKLDAERAKIREAVAYLETLTRSPLRDRVLAVLRGEKWPG
jgi:hypothetical protein